MRKSEKGITIFVPSLVIVAFFIVFISCGKSKPGPEMKVSFLLGSAEKGLDGKWSGIKPGDAVSRQNTVRTGKASKLDINIAGIAGLRLLDQSTVDLAAVVGKDFHLKFHEGNILMKVGKLSGNKKLLVETPTALAAIRGTQFWGQVRKNGQAGTFAVREGTIEITLKKTGSKKILSKGDALDYSGDQKLLKKRNATRAELAAMEQINEIKIGESP